MLAPATNLAADPESGEDVGMASLYPRKTMNPTCCTDSCNGPGSPDDAARKCCNVLNLGECPEWIDGLETCATPGQGATPAQQSWDIIDRLRSEGDYDPSEDLVRDPVCRSAIEEIVALRVLVDEAEHGRAVAVATLSEQLDAANARVATLEAECVAVRRRDTACNVLSTNRCHDDEDRLAGLFRACEDAVTDARSATGPIGGVA